MVSAPSNRGSGRNSGPGGGPGLMRLILATLAGASIGALLLAAVFVGLKLAGEGFSLVGLAAGMALYGSIALAFALPASLLLGLPLFLLLRRFGRLSQPILLLCGGLIASVPFTAFSLQAGPTSSPLDGQFAGIVMLSGLLFLAGGAATALFWRFAGLDREAR